MNSQDTAKIIKHVILHLNRFGSDDKSLQHFAELYDGEYWNSGGNCMLASIPLKYDFMIVVGCESACIYYNIDQVSDEDFMYLTAGKLAGFPYITIWDYAPEEQTCAKEEPQVLNTSSCTNAGPGKTYIASTKLKDSDYIVPGTDFLNRRHGHRRASDKYREPGANK